MNREVSIAGIGLHCGQTIRVSLQPSSEVGVRFKRLDLSGSPQVEADLSRVSATTHATTLELGSARVQTVEHLLAALWASGLTHVNVELDGPEIPILDGSALGWIELLSSAGQRELSGDRPVARLRRLVWFWGEGGAQMLGLPLNSSGEEDEFRLSVGVDFGVAGAGAQEFDGFINPASFARELAPARTFTLEKWLEPLRAAGLIRGGSIDNAIVIGNGGQLSSQLRFENELARHKALDVVGDLALALCSTGARFNGHLIALRAGHGAHRDWAVRAVEQGALVIEEKDN